MALNWAVVASLRSTEWGVLAIIEANGVDKACGGAAWNLLILGEVYSSMEVSFVNCFST